MQSLIPLIIFFASFALSIARINRGILLVLFLLPSYIIRLNIFGFPTTALEMIVLGVIGAWVTTALHKKSWGNPPAHAKPFLIPLALFLIASICAIAFSPHTLPALGHWRAFIFEPVLFAWVMVCTFQGNEENKKKAVWTLACSLIIPTAYALYQKFTGLGIPNEFWAAADTRRVTSVYGYPNAYALYAGPIAILLLAAIRTKWDQAANNRTLLKRPAYLIPALEGTLLALTVIAGIFFTQSKGGLAGLLAGMGMLTVREVNKKNILRGFLLTAVIAAFLATQINLRGIATVQGGDSVSVRLSQYRETWKMLKDHPLTGAGLRGYQTAMVPYHTQKHIEIFMYPHNIFLAMWSELGLLGLIAFVWILFSFFKHSVKSIRHNNLVSNQPFNHAALAAMVTLLIHGLVDVPYFKNDLAMLFWIIIVLGEPYVRHTS